MALNRGKRLRNLPTDVYLAMAREQIKRGMKIDSANGCWIWMKTHQTNGYGQTRFLGRPTPAHRVSYTAFVGPIPDGHEICHKCDIRNCVNPEHLYPGTHAQNMKDMREKGRARGRLSRPGHAADRDEMGRFIKQRGGNCG